MVIRKADVVRAARIYRDNAVELGIMEPGADLQFEAGSQVNGISWGVVAVRPPLFQREKIDGLDLHGAFTAREAYERIIAANGALQAVIRARKADVVED